ncbi:Serine/threonine-protein kinase PknE [Frondihabitans sp. 762G35]|uniref:DsbA family protein n=1 Tax=Frondihabitans sp. 762G35 TaxID=1446794 RepID=UPI000D20686E|nr:thioredoxin domain-containing protein [Frondihabitans sp. 762G35]ARC56471.1 Serine/threonine-protein kinase PknE [Frondihabitans sp. 762G35]
MTPPPDNGPNKRDRREEAREKARVAREAAAKKKRRNRVFAQGGLVVGVLAVATVVVLIIVNATGPGAPGPKNMASDGILLQGNASTGAVTAVQTAALKGGEAPKATDQKAMTKTVNITAYVDFQCPYCNQFETTNATQINEWLKKGAVTYEIHPLAILDASSLGNKYSTRSANAAACVANYEPDKFLDVVAEFYKNQPPEQSNGLGDDKLVSMVKTAGATNASIPKCITDKTFEKWVGDATQRALTQKLPNSSVAKLTGTPTVLVNGKQYGGSLTDAAAFASFVTSQATAK